MIFDYLYMYLLTIYSKFMFFIISHIFFIATDLTLFELYTLRRHSINIKYE